ncbi:MAG: hypothetical protein KME43_19790 [Myxacorys chilensis ATA2-1-KO14]|jgi:hypothetical protein|nr:hypothetical protein [Myxacorys chilensis ATA2-1-KO14]
MMSSHSNESNAIEVNGIRFETVINDRTVVMPPYEPRAEVQVGCGIRLTNMAETAQSVWLYSMHPEFRDATNQLVPGRMVGADRRVKPNLSNLKILQSGESALFICQCTFLWWNNLVRCAFTEKSGNIWAYADLNPDLYSIQFVYNSTLRQQEWFWKFLSIEDRTSLGQAAAVWTGEVTTSPIQFRIVTDVT